MQIVAETEELFLPHSIREAEHFSSTPKPLAGNFFAFGIIIPDTKVFLEIAFCIREAVLGIWREHTVGSSESQLTSCAKNGAGPLRKSAIRG